MNSINKKQHVFVQICQKRKGVPRMKKSRDNDQKRKEAPYKGMSDDKDQQNANKSNKLQLQNHSLTFIAKNPSLPSATSVYSFSSMAHNTTTPLENLTCTVPILWTLENVETVLAAFLGQKLTPTTWTLIIRLSR